MALFTEDSDEDSVATNTTDESEHSDDAGFNVEQILAEDVQPNGVKHYLVKWEGYPLHRCTWEDCGQFGSNIPINKWKARKAAAAQGSEPLFDVEEYEEAYERAEEERADRAERRAKKRERREKRSGVRCDREPVYVDVANEHDMSQSQSPVRASGSAPAAPRRTSAASPVRKYRVAQKITKPTRPVEQPGKSKAPSPASTSKAASTPAQPPSKLIPPSSKPAPPATKPPPSVATPAQPADKPSQAARKTAPSAPLLGPNVPELKRRQRQRVSGETPKNSTAPKFTSLSIQNRYQNYSKNEPAPNINDLVLIDLKTGKPLSNPTKTPTFAEPSARADEQNAPKVAERRPLHTQATREAPVQPRGKTQPPVRRPSEAAVSRLAAGTSTGSSRTMSYPTSTGESAQHGPMPRFPAPQVVSSSSRLSEISSVYGRRTPPPERRRRSPSPVPAETIVQNDLPMADLPPPYPKRGVCKYWESDNCQLTAETCRFAHTRQPKTKRVTCYYWGDGDRCKKTEEQCDFAHHDTGEYAGQPGTFLSKVRSNPMAGPAFSANDVPINDERRQQRFGLPNPEVTPIHPTAEILAPIEPMKIAADDTPMVMDTAPLVKKEYPPLISPAEQDADSFAREIEEDLALTRKTLPELETSKFLTKSENKIKNVYILMPPERAAERELLIKYFKDFECEVFNSGMPSHWNLFRGLNPSLVVIHPDETFCGTLPGFASYLSRLRGWVFSIGVHREFDEAGQLKAAYKARRVFPHAGITFISDDVFAYYPEKAIEIIEEILAKAKSSPPGAICSKLGARPGIRDWLSKLAVQKMEERGEGYTDDRYVKCWDAVCDLCPLEDYDPFEMDQGRMVPQDDALLWSVAEQDLPSFQGLWEKDEAAATDMMANLFAGTAVERMADFQRYSFIYQRPDQVGVDEDMPASQLAPQVAIEQADPKGWMKKYNHIEVMTPDAWLQTTRKRAQQQGTATAKA